LGHLDKYSLEAGRSAIEVGAVSWARPEAVARCDTLPSEGKGRSSDAESSEREPLPQLLFSALVCDNEPSAPIAVVTAALGRSQLA